MNSLLPNMQDALTVHDAAHAQQSAELHGVALKMLALCDQTHICVDGLDEKREQTELDSLPGAIQVNDEAVALIGGVLVSDEVLPESLPGKKMQDKSFQYKPRVPAYEMWLVRKAEAEEVRSECPFEISKHVPVGHPRQNGAYRFPLIAHRMPEAYQMLQVHKDGDVVRVFDKLGNEPKGLAALVDVFVALDSPEQAIFECVWDGSNVAIFDVLMLEGLDCTKLPWTERDKLLGEAIEKNENLPDELVPGDTQRVQSQDGLYMLESGEWIVRYEKELLTDTSRPFWFRHVAGQVIPGKVLPWVHPSETVDDASGYIQVVDTGLPPIQIHKSRNTVSIYVAEGARNRCSNLPQVVEMARDLSEDCIIECMVEVKRNGVMVSDTTLENYRNDLSDCEVVVYPYDIVMWGDETLTERPMYERVDLLEQIITGLPEDKVRFGVVEAGGGWLFTADAERPMNGDCSHCFKKS